MRTNRRARVVCLALLAAVLLAAGAAQATQWFGSSLTMPYYYTERLLDKERPFLSLYQYLDVGATALPNAPGLSFYFAGWGRLDMLEKQDLAFNAPGDAELGSAYLSWTQEERLIGFTAGRQFLHVGSVADRIDGIAIQSDPLPWLGIQAFGGVPVVSQVGERRGDWVFGGRVYGGWRPYFELGFSAATYYEAGDPDRQRIGGDLSVFPARWLDVLAHAYYDVLYGSLYDARATVVGRPVKDLEVRAEYERTMPSAMLGMSSIFSVFSFSTISRVGGEVRYTAVRRVALDAEYQHYLYDDRDPADRFGGTVGVLWGKAREDEAGLGAARLSRKDNGYTELRAFLTQGSDLGIYGTVDATIYLLDDRINDVNQGFSGSASFGYRLPAGLAIQATGLYQRGPHDGYDVRGLLKLAYNVDRTF